jgi:hypothetical protein
MEAEQVLAHYHVENLLTVRLHREVMPRAVRAYGKQSAHVTEQNRYVVQCWRNATAIQQLEQALGWHAYVTNAPGRELSLEQGIQCYADEYLVERNCHRLKGRPLSLVPCGLMEDPRFPFSRIKYSNCWEWITFYFCTYIIYFQGWR